MAVPQKLINRDFVLLWQGRFVSALGTQIFTIAMVLWIKEATGSAAMMGLVMMLSGIPGILLGPIGGTLADRGSRRVILAVADLLNGVAMILLAATMLLAPDAVTAALFGIVAVTVLTAMTGPFVRPTMAASIPDLVPTARISGAVSVMQTSMQISVFVGQALGGTMFRVIGAPIVFLLNGISYLYAALTVLWVRIPPPAEAAAAGWRERYRTFATATGDGFRYIWRRNGLRELVFASAARNFFTAPIILLLPFYIQDVLALGPEWYGYFLATTALGALVGSIASGVVRLGGRGRGRVLITVMILESTGYLLLGVTRSPVAAMGLAFAGGVLAGAFVVHLNTLLQLSTPGGMRGRVFGLLGTVSASVAPVAMGLGGVVADLTGQNIPLIYICSGSVVIAVSVALALNPRVREFVSFEAPPPDAGQPNPRSPAGAPV